MVMPYGENSTAFFSVCSAILVRDEIKKNWAYLINTEYVNIRDNLKSYNIPIFQVKNVKKIFKNISEMYKKF